MLTQKQGRAENLPGGRSLTRAKSSFTEPLSCASLLPCQAPGWQPGTYTTLHLSLRSFSKPLQNALPHLLKIKAQAGLYMPWRWISLGIQPSIIVPL